MRATRRRLVRTAPLLGCVGLLAVLMPARFALAGEAQNRFSRYEQLLASEDLESAVSEGKRIVGSLKAALAKVPSAESIENRVSVAEQARDLALYKLSMILRNAHLPHPTPFLYVAPSPKDLFEQSRWWLDGARPLLKGLDEEETAFALSYLETVVRSAAAKVVDAYSRVLSSGAGEEAPAMARAYLTAYLLGAHRKSELPVIFVLLRDQLSHTEGLTFIVQDALHKLGEPGIALETAILMLESRDAAVSANALNKTLLEVAENASEKGEHPVAIAAYRKLVELEGPQRAEEALYKVIAICAHAMQDPSAAVGACTDYLRAFPDSSRTPEVLYRRALYRYGARKFDSSLEDLDALESKEAFRSFEPRALILAGMNHAALGDAAKAVSEFAECAERFPKDKLAAKALFLQGSVFLAAQKPAEARECFQKIVDFYTASQYAHEAREYLEGLSVLPQQP